MGLALSPFLNIGMMLAVSQSSGKLPRFKDWAKLKLELFYHNSA